jgi:predicted metal-dependent enzyme (double-stranded beta helix superfamily)
MNPLTLPAPAAVAGVIRGLDEAVAAESTAAVTAAVKAVLQATIGRGGDLLPSGLLQPTARGYARRLLHLDPAGRYSVVVMVWGPGQGTDLHDHAGSWCVECVYRGEIEVTSHALLTEVDAPLLRFREMGRVRARPGDAGALIPPFEYHRIANAGPEPAVTVHVYAGEMRHCHVFLPVDGGYRRELRPLGYTEPRA